MVNTKNINWVDSAELKAVRIDKNYGKKETYTSLVLLGVVSYLTIIVISSFFIINYGEIVISYLKNMLYQNNFFNIAISVLSVLAFVCFLVLVWFSAVGINKTKVGINHQVNTKENFSLNVVSLVFSSILTLLLVVLTILRLFVLKGV